MAIRNDVTIDVSASPRIATVASPSTSITIQDLHDTLRHLEARPWNMFQVSFLNSTGKDDLGGGVRVGVTLRLKNTLLAFEARPGPSFTICMISGGNLVAVDASGASLSTPIHPTAYVQVVLAQSSSATQLGTSLTDEQQAQLDNVEYLAGYLKKIQVNRLELQPGASANWKLYDDDDVTLLRTWDVTDASGEPIAVPAGAPARRSRGV